MKISPSEPLRMANRTIGFYIMKNTWIIKFSMPVQLHLEIEGFQYANYDHL